MMEQNQRRLELELSQKDLQNKALHKAIGHLQYQMQEEKRRRKREKSRVKKVSLIYYCCHMEFEQVLLLGGWDSQL